MEGLITYLHGHGLIDTTLYSELSADSRIKTNGALEAALREAGISKADIRRVLAEYYQLESAELSPDTPIGGDVLAYIPQESASHYRIMPLAIESGVLKVGANNPEDVQMREALNFLSSKHNVVFQFVFMLDEDIEAALKRYDNITGDVSDALNSLESEINTDTTFEADKPEPVESYEHIKEDAPVTKIVASILRYAVDGSASDIHVEPTEAKVKVRFRVDGILQTSLELPKNIQNAVAARIKILASLRLDERRKPQDGRFSATFDGRKIDFRVSVLPTNHGEKVVMRILDNEKGVRTLKDVGISEYHAGLLRRALSEPYGIILISGPTGSGKSTTLYAMLAEIDKESQNVMSLEDPVEYNMAGVSQSQMRPEIGYTFAAGLRSALRQDPDIIMVGEIRDKETAQLAIQAALTGHLVISTIHTNNSIGVIPRLIDMGVDPYLIAPTLKLAVAQRLARRLKAGTGKEIPISSSTEMMIKDTFATLPEKYRSLVPTKRTMKVPEPSPGCATGLKGRVAVMEALEITDLIQSLILKGASEEQIYDAARANGFMSMKEDAIIKALDHVIPPEEMNAFSSQLALVTETMVPFEASSPVDNQDTGTIQPAIINSNENIAS